MEPLILPNSQTEHCYSIFPSLLSADTLRLGEEVTALINTGVEMIHLDIMDNHYVPNLTFGPDLARRLHQQFPTLGIDVHLMTTPVDALIEQFATSGATRISIHPEATSHLDRSLQLIRAHGCQVGLVLNPATLIETLRWCHHRLDFILLMTVNPGFGGQTLIKELIPKITCVHKMFPSLPLCVDGGVNQKNIAALAHAGATQFIVGAALFKEKNYQHTLATLHQQLHHNA